jgi:hypothetical protein
MLRTVVAALFLMCTTASLCAAETEPFNLDEPFEQALTKSLLRSLLNQALDKLHDHVEITGNVNSDALKDDEGKHLRFKFFPEGKSQSGQHLTAEGWFHFSPETGRHDWHFRFKLPEGRSKTSPPQFEAPL